jgi:hypothetical protein
MINSSGRGSLTPALSTNTPALDRPRGPEIDAIGSHPPLQLTKELGFSQSEFEALGPSRTTGAPGPTVLGVTTSTPSVGRFESPVTRDELGETRPGSGVVLNRHSASKASLSRDRCCSRGRVEDFASPTQSVPWPTTVPHPMPTFRFARFAHLGARPPARDQGRPKPGKAW